MQVGPTGLLVANRLLDASCNSVKRLQIGLNAQDLPEPAIATSVAKVGPEDYRSAYWYTKPEA